MYLTMFLTLDRPTGTLPDGTMVNVVCEVPEDSTVDELMFRTMKPAAHALLDRLIKPPTVAS